ncbi:hypothetical protein EAS64_42540 [Trebonia kvetii]|uniref:PLD phosphodiesterase domain-containing protein n=1 Tax=Trebonia kvetii TaxID=2480626 RepID=A0A6P2BKQ0_9ACTN|nr:hypothetical protein [Trebonia kvetii]TVY98984.1 hypothetical protein EAS64_42540 [Trebonia kvetii]
MSAGPRPSIVIPDLLQGQWTTALICTFGADLLFFETRLMTQLAQVPLRIILADDRRLASTLGEAARTGQRHRLANKAYVAAPIRHPRAAHGKLALLLGPANGRLIIGSGNLGYDGYASPGELWHVFAYSDDNPQHLSEFAAARSFIDELASRQLLDPPVTELLHTTWGMTTWLPPAPAAPATLCSNLNRPLIEQLRDRAPGQVTELVAYAPFHDEDCAALRALITAFTPERVRLLVTDATSAHPAAIKQALGDSPKRIIELVRVKEEPAAYIYAKWVHLIHPDAETLLTGSANLSRSALLQPSSAGNIEIGVISAGPSGTFDGLYAHLQSERGNDASALGITYRAGSEDDNDGVAPCLAVLWSRLDGDTLSITFSGIIPEGMPLLLEDHAGRALAVVSTSSSGATLSVKLDKESADRLAEGGRVAVRTSSAPGQLWFTWPYQLSHLRGRLDRASQRERLPAIADLPQQDSELYELLRELDQTLIIDRESAWRIAKPGGVPQADDGNPELIRLEDLDWDRIRRDPRYSGYFTRGRPAGLPPTDIQVILAAIAGRLGDLALGTARPDAEDEEDLAREGDAGISSESEETDEELEDEVTRRRLPVSTRTRMAFDRFVRRYASALTDTAFIDELGPIPAATNAVIFGHLLSRLLEREAVSPRRAIPAQIATWRFLWRNDHLAAGTQHHDAETSEAVRHLLTEADAQVTTLQGLVASLGHAIEDDTVTALRDIARHLLTDTQFGLDANLLSAAAGGDSMAPGFLGALSQIAEPVTAGEIIDYVLAPCGIPRSSAQWHADQVRRPGLRNRIGYQSTTFVITTPIEDLSVQRARELLERVAVAASFSRHDATYVRIRFEGNGKAVAYWDADARYGLVRIDDDTEEDLESFAPAWPDWQARANELQAEIADRSPAAQSA